MRFQPCKVSIPGFEVDTRKPPVVRRAESVGRIITNSSKILQYLVPYPVPGDEEVSRIESLAPLAVLPPEDLTLCLCPA